MLYFPHTIQTQLSRQWLMLSRTSPWQQSIWHSLIFKCFYFATLTVFCVKKDMLYPAIFMQGFSPGWKIYESPLVPMIAEVELAGCFPPQMMIIGNIFILYFCLGLVNKWWHSKETLSLTRALASMWHCGRRAQEVSTEASGSSGRGFFPVTQSMPGGVSSVRALEVLHSQPVCHCGFCLHCLEGTINRWYFETLMLLANRVISANCPILQAVIRYIVINK